MKKISPVFISTNAVFTGYFTGFTGLPAPSAKNHDNYLGMNTKSAKRKATLALREIIEAAKKYAQAENELEQALRQEKTQTQKEQVRCTA